MGRNATHSRQIAAANQARTAAIKKLIEAHQAEYNELYREEAAARGVTPRRSARGTDREARLARIRAEVMTHPLRKAFPDLEME